MLHASVKRPLCADIGLALFTAGNTCSDAASCYVVLQVAAVLSVIVEVSCVLDCQSLCSLLQLNTVCRKAVLGSRGHHSISIEAVPHKVAGFAAWLPRHAGLVAGLQLVRRSDSFDPVINWTKYKLIEKALASGLQQSSAAGHAVPPFSTSAAHPGTADAPYILLLLASFGSQVYVSPAVLRALPCALLTCLELDQFCYGGCYHRNNKSDVLAMLRQLTSLNNLKLRNEYDSICSCLRGLSDLPPLLTRLNIGPLESVNASVLPPSLVELKLMVELDDPRKPPSDEYDDDGEWVEPEVDQELLQAAKRLDLTHLPLLQRCEVHRKLTEFETDGYYYWDYSQTMTIELAAPNLTRLQLDGNFSDVLGLPVPCLVQELCLVSCSIRGSRLACLISHMPHLVDFFYHSFEHNLEDYLLSVPMEEEQLVAAALGGATKLTSLYVDGLGMGGHMVWCEDGLVEAHRRVDRIVQESEQGLDQDSQSSSMDEPEQDLDDTHWGRHISGLVNLRKLDLFVHVDDSDVLQLTTLTALTYLQLAGLDVADETFKVVRAHLSALQVLNPPGYIDLSW